VVANLKIVLALKIPIKTEDEGDGASGTPRQHYLLRRRKRGPRGFVATVIFGLRYSEFGFISMVRPCPDMATNATRPGFY
jgi:hypothetical protein